MMNIECVWFIIIKNEKKKMRNDIPGTKPINRRFVVNFSRKKKQIKKEIFSFCSGIDETKTVETKPMKQPIFRLNEINE